MNNPLALQSRPILRIGVHRNASLKKGQHRQCDCENTHRSQPTEPKAMLAAITQPDIDLSQQWWSSQCDLTSLSKLYKILTPGDWRAGPLWRRGHARRSPVSSLANDRTRSVRRMAITYGASVTASVGAGAGGGRQSGARFWRIQRRIERRIREAPARRTSNGAGLDASSRHQDSSPYRRSRLVLAVLVPHSCRPTSTGLPPERVA